ncbi:hypothetical protein [Chitinophaga sp. 212800010-3]|uniref:hypothetical protein n=1 Tax=unclassified Chitinophaga TaxID=2619133 RepID=UPI002DF35820|nr:DinB superfamily protein [Chitinophaga sp. 212800010-3]
MLTYSIINFHELTPGHLCLVIANKFHWPIQHQAEQVMAYFNLDRQDDGTTPPVADLQQLLFSRMHAEINQLIRKESTLLFPVIRNQSALKMRENIQPVVYESIQQSFQKITLLLQRLRQVSGNYQLHPEWSATYRLCINDIFLTEQLLHQWIYVEQNILYSTAVPGHQPVAPQQDTDNQIID